MERDNLPLYTQIRSPQIVQKETISNLEQPGQHATPNFPPPGLHPTQQMLLLGPENTETTCPFCRAHVKTAVKYTSNARTHIAAALCGLLCCCCCVPYSSNSAKNSDHYCPNCERYLGTYHK